MALKESPQTSTGPRVVLRMLAFVAILSLAACGASGALAGTSQSDVQGAALQNATASTACQPWAPTDAPPPGTGRHF
ncbi:MAG: hypothetical protein AABM32_11965 [Chloroflexota bacterium]